MSSTPFQLGIPVVDKLEPINGNWVLRSKNSTEASNEIKRVCGELYEDDVIMTFPLRYYPDHPVPVCMYFTEVKIEKDYKGDGISFYAWVGNGKKKKGE